MTKKIWGLQFDSNNSMVLRTEIDYFQTHFIGNSMAHNWEPPAIRISNKSKKRRDILSWMLTAPAISEKAKVALEPLISPYVEFLPLINLKGMQYFALNVTHLIACLDFTRSEIHYYHDDPSCIQNVSKTYFIEEKLQEVPIFKIKEWPSDVFVTQIFVDTVIENSIDGAIFVDPKYSHIQSLFMKGKQIGTAIMLGE